jgi:hypothetical protein
VPDPALPLAVEMAFGSVVITILGWLVGVMLLRASRVWTTREKLIGTVLTPGGLSALLYLLVTGSSTCTESSGAGRPTIEHCAAVSRRVSATHCSSRWGSPESLRRPSWRTVHPPPEPDVCV